MDLFDMHQEAMARAGMFSIRNVVFSLEPDMKNFTVHYRWGDQGKFLGVIIQVRNKEIIYYNKQDKVDMKAIMIVLNRIGVSI